MTYSARGREADVRARDIRLGAGGSRLRVECSAGVFDLEVGLPGRFNVSNALAAFATGLLLAVPVDTIVEGIASVDRVPGRMERLEGRGIQVIIDYAHTPEALENLLAAVEETFPGRRITVFGCGGDRDREKRPLMGEVAARRSDRLVITSDNPRGEDPERILDQIEAGVRRVRDDFTRLSDREEAIHRAIDEAEAGDVVIIAGKGHEDYQLVGEERRHFDDREVARRILSSGGGDED
jgi:UDP-N-acetylmuramoyl-L-alanyl-D-glutamate--2,6-diaminopimelate ligase